MEIIKIHNEKNITIITAVYPHKQAMKSGSLGSLNLKMPRLKPCKSAIKTK